MAKKVRVALIGIPEHEKRYFDQVVRFSRSRQWAYELCGEAPGTPVELVVADDEGSALERGHALVQGGSAVRLVVVSNQGSSSHSMHLLTRPLLISKVLRVLDAAAADLPESAPTMDRNLFSLRGRKSEPAREVPTTQAQINRPGKLDRSDDRAPAVKQRLASAHMAPFPKPAPAESGADMPRFSRRPERSVVSVPGRSRAPTQTPSVPRGEAKESVVRIGGDVVMPAQVRPSEPFPPVVQLVPAPETMSAATKTSFTALVVDDSLAIRKQLEIELEEAGIAAEYAETGEQALEMAAESHFDLVFLDIMMPGIDGYEVCKTLRKVPEHKKTPIIMLSGKTSPLDEVQGVLAGATTYLTKPVNHAGFQSVLSRVVKWLDDYRPGG